MERASLLTEREAAKSLLQGMRPKPNVFSVLATVVLTAANTVDNKTGNFVSTTGSVVSKTVSNAVFFVLAAAMMIGGPIFMLFVALNMRSMVGIALFEGLVSTANPTLLEIHEYKDRLGIRNVFLLQVTAFLDACAQKKLQDVVVFHDKRDKVQDMTGLSSHMAKSFPSIQLIDFVERPELNVDKMLSAIVFLGDALLKDKSFWCAFKLVLDKDVKVFVQGQLSSKMKKLLIDGIDKKDLSALLPGSELDLVYLAKTLLGIPPFVVFDGELKATMEKAWVAGLMGSIRTQSESKLAKILAKEDTIEIDKAKQKFCDAGGNLGDCNIALIGEVDSGKSCMVNSFVGKKVAAVKRGECTNRVASYCKQAGEMVLWDHPGIGAKLVPDTSNYVEKNHLLAYDLVVIVCDSSVNQVLDNIISELNRFRVQFILVRTKVDINVEESEESEEEACDEVRMDLANDLADTRVVSEVFPIFLVCAKEGQESLFDGPKLNAFIDKYAEVVKEAKQ